MAVLDVLLLEIYLAAARVPGDTACTLDLMFYFEVNDSKPASKRNAGFPVMDVVGVVLL